jgi:AcrR family transcriptional regulator
MNHKQPAPERLLAAAADLFAREGFDAVSVRQITSKAKANLGAVTYHFGSKEALFHAVIERIGVPFADQFTSLAAGAGAPIDRIGRIVTMVLTEPNLPAPTMILRELATDRPLPPPLIRMMQRNMGTIAALILEGQGDGSIRAGDPGLLAMSVMAQPFLLRMASRIPRDVAGVDRNDPATQRKLVKHVVTTITRSLATHPDRIHPERRP